MPLGKFYGFQTFECMTPGGEAWQKSLFAYDTSTKVIGVNSTWSCGG